MNDPNPGFYVVQSGHQPIIKWLSIDGRGGCLAVLPGQVPTIERLLREAQYEKQEVFE